MWGQKSNSTHRVAKNVFEEFQPFISKYKKEKFFIKHKKHNSRFL
jgi:hypothetical protein